MDRSSQTEQPIRLIQGRDGVLVVGGRVVWSWFFWPSLLLLGSLWAETSAVFQPGRGTGFARAVDCHRVEHGPCPSQGFQCACVVRLASVPSVAQAASVLVPKGETQHLHLTEGYTQSHRELTCKHSGEESYWHLKSSLGSITAKFIIILSLSYHYYHAHQESYETSEH